MISDVPAIDSPNQAPQGCGPLSGPVTGARSLRLQVFEAVRATGLLSRVDAGKQINVSPASITAAVSELIDAGFLQEVATPRREGDSARGRPPVALGVRAEARLVAGIKLSDQVHSAIIVDFAGGHIADASLPRNAENLDLQELLAEAVAVLDAALRAAGRTRRDLAAVGIGIPGFVDNLTGEVLWTPLLAEGGLNLRDAMQSRLALPVHVDNDANLVTLAELWYGAGRATSDFAVITIEHGVGMGLVLNHSLYRGARGLGTELAHTKVQLDGALCRCGQRGCLEAYVSDYALIREARTALNLGNRGVKSPQVLLEALFDNAKSGNQAARAIFHRAGRYLALGLANVVNLFDPSLIMLSGERMRYDYLYADEVLADMQALTLQSGRPLPKIEIHAWGDLVWARGAAVLALEAATLDAIGPEVSA